MSLMQLLTVTRSIKTVKNQPSPYRMKQEHLLPKLSPAKEGEEEASAGEASAAPVEGQTPAPVVTAQTPKIGFFSRWLRVRKAVTRSCPAAGRPDAGASGIAARGGASGAKRFQRKCPVFQFPSRSAPAKPQAVGGHWWLRVQARLFGARRKQS